MRRSHHWLPLSFAFCASLACGGGGGGLSAPTEDIPVPLSVDGAAGVGAVVLTRRTRDPETLGDGHCDLTAWLARASAASTANRIDQEGACLLLATEPSPSAYTPPLEPVCAGAFRVAYGPGSRAITFCDLTAFPAPLDVDCADVAMASGLAASSLPNELPGDELSSLDLMAHMPGIPTISVPTPQGDGTAVWPSADLDVRWSGSAASSVEIALRARPSSGKELHCFVPDTGRFSLPERLVAEFRDVGASLEVTRASVSESDADGFKVRVSGRVSDAIWLFPSSAP